MERVEALIESLPPVVVIIIAVVLIAAVLYGLAYLATWVAPSAIKYADSYNRVLVLEVESGKVLY
ncbi:MAG: hypothetical protein ACP5J3_13140, partial [Pyrobaculum sp.]